MKIIIYTVDDDYKQNYNYVWNRYYWDMRVWIYIFNINNVDWWNQYAGFTEYFEFESKSQGLVSIWSLSGL